jgi:hypothetical protein
MKIRPVGAELFHTDGRTDTQTDMTKLIVAFRNFADAPTKCKVFLYTFWDGVWGNGGTVLLIRKFESRRRRGISLGPSPN